MSIPPGAGSVGGIGKRTARRLAQWRRGGSDRRHDVQGMITLALRHALEEPDLEWPLEASLSVPRGSAEAWIEVFGEADLPAVRFDAILLEDVQVSTSLLARVNEINQQLSFGCMYAVDGAVHLSYVMLADKLTEQEFLLALDFFLDAADTWDTALHSVFGGRTAYGDRVFGV